MAHERGERNSHHHMNGVIVVRSTGSDADKIKYARNLLRTCFLRVAEVRSPRRIATRPSLPRRRRAVRDALRRHRRPCALAHRPRPRRTLLLPAGPELPHHHQGRCQEGRAGARLPPPPHAPHRCRCPFSPPLLYSYFVVAPTTTVAHPLPSSFPLPDFALPAPSATGPHARVPLHQILACVPYFTSSPLARIAAVHHGLLLQRPYFAAL